MADIPTFPRVSSGAFKRFHDPGRTIDFGDHETFTTEEVLDILGISYSALASRRDRSGFPQPITRGVNGKKAMYERGALEQWCLANGFRVKRKGVLL